MNCKKKKDEDKSLLKALLDAEDPEVVGQKSLSHSEVIGNAMTFLTAGQDTTGTTTAWMLWFIASDARIQTAVQQEVDCILPDGMTRSERDAEKLVYVTAIFKETLRLRSPAPYVITQPTHDLELDGVAMTRKDLVFSACAVMMQNDRYFTDAKKFYPDRWLFEKESMPEGFVHNTNAFIPFGGGPRVCPGRVLAQHEAVLITAVICRNFTLSLIDPNPPKQIQQLTWGPVEFQIRFTPRLDL